jgi:hypothetical protein
MRRMSGDEIRAVFREVLLPELQALHAEFRAIQAEVALMRAATGPLRSLLLAGFQRLDARLEAMEYGVRHAAPCFRSSRRLRSGRRRR